LAYALPRPVISSVKAWFVVFGMLVLMIASLLILPAWPYLIGHKPLYYANQFFTDWLIGLIIAIALWLLPTQNVQAQPSALSKRFRFAADLTFPLYVLHFPLMVLWIGLFGLRLNDWTQLIELLFVVTIVAVLIGVFLEKYRPLWDQLFKRVVGVFADGTFKRTTSGEAVSKSNYK
jgi:peptidoglycan/LPS O-acetylase OafA/YrhL